MAPPTRTSRLDAVNTILRTAGETPVANLSSEAGVESVIAEQTLDDIDREIQSSGWSWNRDCETLLKDPSDKIPVREQIIRLDGPEGSRYSVRGGNLFDLVDAVDTFSSDVELTVVELLDWDDLPEQARRYITVKAARRYTDQQIGDQLLSQYTRQDELEAYQQLRKHELKAGQYNVFDPRDKSFVNRGAPLFYRY